MLRQGLRYRRLLVLALLAGAVLVPAAVLMRGGQQVDAQALVIAQRLDVELAALPRYAEAVFHDGRVARAVAEELGVDASEVVPDRVSLVSEPDGIALLVVGHAEDEATAARIADVAAEAYVHQLNAAGAGVGDFALQQAAGPPAARDAGRAMETWTIALPSAITAAIAVGVVLLFRTRAAA